MYTFTFQLAQPDLARCRAEALALLSAPVTPFAVNQRVKFLGIIGTVIAVKPSSVQGGETRFWVEWVEPAAGNARRVGSCWAEDLEAAREVETARA